MSHEAVSALKSKWEDYSKYHSHWSYSRPFLQVGEVTIDGGQDMLHITTCGSGFVLLDVAAREALNLLLKQEDIPGLAVTLCVTTLVASVANPPQTRAVRLESICQAMQRASKAVAAEANIKAAFEQVTESVARRLPNVFDPGLWVRHMG